MPAMLDIRPGPAKGTNVIHAGCNQAASLRQLGSITDKKLDRNNMSATRHRSHRVAALARRAIQVRSVLDLKAVADLVRVNGDLGRVAGH